MNFTREHTEHITPLIWFTVKESADTVIGTAWAKAHQSGAGHITFSSHHEKGAVWTFDYMVLTCRSMAQSVDHLLQSKVTWDRHEQNMARLEDITRWTP